MILAIDPGTRLTADLPVMIETGKKEIKRNYLNMNNYRNWPYHLNSDLKLAFKPLQPILPFRAEKIRVSYEYTRSDRRRVDLMNVVCVVDKFFMDWLVKEGYIPDDTIYNVEYGFIRPIIDLTAETNSLKAYIEILG